MAILTAIPLMSVTAASTFELSRAQLLMRVGLCWLTVETIYLSYSHVVRSLRGVGSFTRSDLIVNAVHWTTLMAMTALFFGWRALRFPTMSRWRLAAWLVAGTLCLAGVKTLLNDALQQGVHRGWYRLAVEFMPALIDVAVTIGVAYGINLYEAKRRLEANEVELAGALFKSQLAALRAKLQPHFLFNTLNAISSRVDTNPPDAQRMIGRLGDLLRMSIHSDTAVFEAPVAAELAFTAAYLELQGLRFGSRLQLVVDVDDDVRRAVIPTLVLQPLIENSIRHAVEQIDGPVELGIEIRRRGDRLHIAVWNSGPPLRATERPGGLGLSNTRARLAHMYGDAARLEIADRPGGGVRTEIEIPFTLGES